MMEGAPGADALMREPAAGESGPLPCVVRHADAGGRGGRPAALEGWGLALCAVHGAEAKAGALAEMYGDAADFLGRLDNAHVPDYPNPAAQAALRRAVSGLQAAGSNVARGEEEALLAAYPLIPERADGATLEYDWHAFRGALTPDEAFYLARALVCRLMRLAFEAGAGWLVEVLEPERESVAAQTAFAVALRDRDCEERAKERRRPEG